MLYLNPKQFINPEMSKYITEQTNKFTNKCIEKYSNNPNPTLCLSLNPVDKNSILGLRVSGLVKPTDVVSKIPNTYVIIPFVSLIFFLTGYNFCNLINK